MNEPEKQLFKDHFSGCAARYAEHRPRYPVELSEFLARTAPRRELTWDCGCGSGQLSEDLAGRFARVIATDASADQIAQAPAHPRIEYHCARAEASGLPDACADLVVAAQAAHWFDLPAWYAEVRRVGSPGSIVGIAGYGNLVAGDGLDAVVTRFYSGVLGPYWPPERRLVEDGYRNLPFPFEEIEVPRFEMLADWTLEQFLGYVRTWSAVGAIEATRGGSAFEAFRAELARVWGASGTSRTVRWPLSVRVGRI